MSRKYNLYQVDSFTRDKFLGNPAGVITNADGLTDDEMQKIARELNNSETAFIFASKEADYDVYIRYFTPAKEVPICGHATIAAHYARAIEKNLKSTRVIQKSSIGILPVDIVKRRNDYQIIMTQGSIEFSDLMQDENKNILLTALKIKEEDLLSSCPIQIVSTGHSKVIIGIKSYDLLNKIKPNNEMLCNLSKRIGCNGYYVFTMDSNDENILVKGRMFAPAIGINEDPVTGNANGPLGAYLIKHNLVEHNGSFFKFNAKQGEVMGRTGTIEVQVEITNNKPTKVKILGEAVIAFQAELEIPSSRDIS